MNTPNMSYCRFRNTLLALNQCIEDWDLNDDATIEEIEAKKKLIRICENIAEDNQ